MRRKCQERFPRHWSQRKQLLSDPGMHHGTCVTHVPWCKSGSLIHGGRENVPGIPWACATRNFTHLARGPLAWCLISHVLTHGGHFATFFNAVLAGWILNITEMYVVVYVAVDQCECGSMINAGSMLWINVQHAMRTFTLYLLMIRGPFY